MGGRLRLSTAKVGAPSSPSDDANSTVALRAIEPVRDAIARFPATRYYGSKRKLLAWMYTHLGPLQFDSALDAFGGTGSVSLLLKSMRKRVTYHDGLQFNRDVGRAILADKPAYTKEKVSSILDCISPSDGVISENFSGIFFKDEENRWLDGFSKFTSEISEDRERSLLLYLIYQACLKKRPFNLFHRANLKLRTNNAVQRTFGNAVTWERSFQHHALQAYDELARSQTSHGVPASVLPSGRVEDITPGYDLVYIDPPYISREERYNRDDYWRRYHFLEGLARYDSWSELIDRTSDIRMIEAPAWFKEWGRARFFKDRLFSFIDTHRSSIVVLSYVTDAIPSELEIKNYFESRFSRVSVHSSEHSHALSLARKRELLFVGYPR